ncbi:S-glutathionyl-(chloro)hydroquinone reductase [Ascosphaera acerosa]|nr:S-glutathionyl-(chloro)hydroquinone reductase [Ascosphaera acerosa]
MPSAAADFLLRILPARLLSKRFFVFDSPAALLLTLGSASRRVLTPSSPQSFRPGHLTSTTPTSTSTSSPPCSLHDYFSYRVATGTSRSSTPPSTTDNSGQSHALASGFRMAGSSEKGDITSWVKPGDNSGEFKRQESKFRERISRQPGAKYPPEKGRYHLYVSYACPWAHRTLIVRKLKGLEDFISFSTVHWHMGEGGWRFPTPDDKDCPGEGAVPDPIHPDFHHLSQVYYETDPEYSQRFTVPVLYDKQTKTVVSNESAEIIRMLYHEFDDLLPDASKQVDLYPADLRAAIDEANSWIYDTVNNGVYKSGFATTQEAYERNVRALFASLDRIEGHLAAQPKFFFGDRLTEADVRLFTTIVRFDPVYVQHFKCNVRDIRSGYPAIHRWLRTLYWTIPAFRETTEFTHIKNHYTKSHTQINPHSITPVGPVPDVLPLDEEVEAVKHRM